MKTSIINNILTSKPILIKFHLSTYYSSIDIHSIYMYNDVKCVNCAIHHYRATNCDFQQCGILTSVDSDEPAQPLLSLETPNAVKVSSLTFIEY